MKVIGRFMLLVHIKSDIIFKVEEAVEKSMADGFVNCYGS